jgi:ankyrin repeat protein
MAFKEPVKTFVVSILSGISVLIVFLCFLRPSQRELYSRIVSGDNEAFDEYISRKYDLNYGGDIKLIDEAVTMNNSYMVNILLKKGVKVNTANQRLVTPLMRAALYADAGIVQTLIQHGAIVTNRDASGDNAVNFAATGNPENIYLLVAAGANVNNTNNNGDTPLSLAVACHEKNKRFYVAIMTLLSLGANVNCTNKDGLTPIMIAARHGDTNLVQLLIQTGVKQK